MLYQDHFNWNKMRFFCKYKFLDWVKKKKKSTPKSVTAHTDNILVSFLDTNLNCNSYFVCNYNLAPTSAAFIISTISFTDLNFDDKNKSLLTAFFFLGSYKTHLL